MECPQNPDKGIFWGSLTPVAAGSSKYSVQAQCIPSSSAGGAATGRRLLRSTSLPNRALQKSKMN